MIEMARLKWCPGTESNRHAPFGARDFKSRASASFATRALTHNYIIVQNLLHSNRLWHDTRMSIGVSSGVSWTNKLLDCRQGARCA